MKANFIKLNVDGDFVLVPVDPESLRNVPEHQEVILDIKMPRNPKYNRYAFQAMRAMFDMVDNDMPFEKFRRLLTIKAGFYTTIGKVKLDGTTSVAVYPDSLSFEAMDEDEFRKVFQAIHHAFGEKYCRELTVDQLTEWSII